MLLSKATYNKYICHKKETTDKVKNKNRCNVCNGTVLYVCSFTDSQQLRKKEMYSQLAAEHLSLTLNPLLTADTLKATTGPMAFSCSFHGKQKTNTRVWGK